MIDNTIRPIPKSSKFLLSCNLVNLLSQTYCSRRKMFALMFKNNCKGQIVNIVPGIDIYRIRPNKQPPTCFSDNTTYLIHYFYCTLTRISLKPLSLLTEFRLRQTGPTWDSKSPGTLIRVNTVTQVWYIIQTFANVPDIKVVNKLWRVSLKPASDTTVAVCSNWDQL